MASDLRKAQQNASKATARARARDLLNDIKDVPCADCGEKYPPYVMDFDHRGNKKFNVARGASLGYTLERLLTEIAKCDIVCANCHRMRTYGNDSN